MNVLTSYIDIICKNLSQLQKNKAINNPPFYSSEIIIKLPPIVSNITSYLDSLSLDQILLLSGRRVTPGSIFEQLPPNDSKLISSASEMYNEFLTVSARALSKHIFRSNYWGTWSGKNSDKNKYASEKIKEILQNRTWWNIFGHFKHKKIYEARIPSGHGARWSMDPIVFIGFVEPNDPLSNNTFRQY